MDLSIKLKVLADAAKYDASCASSGAKRRNTSGPRGLGNSDGTGICHSYTPDGRCVSLLKILLTNYCIFDCRYCVNRVSSDVQRARFSIDEVIHLTMEFYRRNYIEGLFLSSGIIQNADYTMEQLAGVARRLRTEQYFHGYIHLKAVPGAAPELLEEAGRYADRLSANIELPVEKDLRELAPEKTLRQIESAMTDIRGRIDAARDEQKKSKIAPRFAPSGQSTQMIVGATPAPDTQVIHTAARLYETHKLRRVYYSAFSPIPHGDPRLPMQSPVLMREHRLYQADWLMRFYGFSAGEVAEAAGQEGNLPLDMDPKLAWALNHRGFFPVDLNAGSYEAILRVPGIGARSARRIVAVRKHQRIRLADLQTLGVALKRTRPFVVTADHNPDAKLIDAAVLSERVKPRHEQLELFTAASSAQSGEL